MYPKAIASVAMCIAIGCAVYKTGSAWCLWALWLVYGVWWG